MVSDHVADGDSSDSDDEDQFLTFEPMISQSDGQRELRASDVTGVENEEQETATSPTEMGTNAVSQSDLVEASDTSDQEVEDGPGGLTEERVLSCDEASDPEEEDASDPGERLTPGVAGRSDDSATTASGLRWSDRRSRPPARLAYHELGNPVAQETVPEQGTADAQHVNVSTVHSQGGHEEQGWWDWFQDTMECVGLH